MVLMGLLGSQLTVRAGRRHTTPRTALLQMPTVKEGQLQGTKTNGDAQISAGVESGQTVLQSPLRQFHPFIEGLLQKLPPAETEWSREDRKRWLQTAANIFDLMYVAKADEGDKSVVVQIS